MSAPGASAPAGSLCVVTAAYPAPSEPTRAGFLADWLEALAAEGHYGVVVTPRIAATDPVDESPGNFEVLRFDAPTGGRRLKEIERPSPWLIGRYLLSGFRRTVGAIRRERASLVYAHWVLPAGLIGAWAAAWTRRPLVLHAHGSDLVVAARASRLARALARYALGRARALFVTSEELRRIATGEFGFPPSRCFDAPMGLPDGVFTPRGREEDRAEFCLDPSRLEILYVGDLDPRKGIVDLARSWITRPELLRGARLHVVGGGIEDATLREIEGRSEGSLVLQGRLDPPGVARWMRASDALVLPSMNEGMPLVVLEALASGLPVVATSVGGIPEVLEEEAGGWLEPAERFPDRLVWLLENREELEARRRELSTRPLGEKYSVRERVRSVARILEAVRDGRDPAGGRPASKLEEVLEPRAGGGRS